MTGADLLLARLRNYGVEQVFGYPGGPLVPLYDALHPERQKQFCHGALIRHILARDERGAGFMADGFSRATGLPGVCLAVCGPGAFNAFTPLLTAFSDSVPFLVISGQMPAGGSRSGFYHENDQQSACESFTKARASVNDAAMLVLELDRLWRTMQEGRPGPALLDVTAAALLAEVPGQKSSEINRQAHRPAPIAPKLRDIAALARLVAGWQRPLILVGGGVITSGASEELKQVAERLSAPVFNSLMGKCALPSDHPLSAGMPWRQSTSDTSDMASRISPLFQEADGLLVIGCRFSQVITGSWALKVPKSLAQVDIDGCEFGRHYPVQLGIQADAREALRALLALLPSESRPPWVAAEQLASRRIEKWLIGGMDLSGAARRALPKETIVVADVTQLAYRMLVEFPVYAPRTFLHPAGAVSMGYGLPAAIGAKTAFPDRPVVAIVGDGCFQMTGFELATAVQEKLPVVVLLVNDRSLTLIKLIQERRFQGRYIGVDLQNPDFGVLAQAYGVRYWAADSEPMLEDWLQQAISCRATALVEMRL